jgi:hypothetical protein
MNQDVRTGCCPICVRLEEQENRLRSEYEKTIALQSGSGLNNREVPGLPKVGRSAASRLESASLESQIRSPRAQKIRRA